MGKLRIYDEVNGEMVSCKKRLVREELRNTEPMNWGDRDRESYFIFYLVEVNNETVV
jgi:hypothetical protein